jgi:hypothetical protein
MSDGRVRFDLGFLLALGQCWVIGTTLLAYAGWSGDRTPRALAEWSVLWIFTVAAPTIQALKVHRRLRELQHASPHIPERALRDLLEARTAFPLLGSLVVLWAFALGLGR